MVVPGVMLERLNSPFRSVIVPLVVPLTTTEAPMMVSPEASFTIPVHGLFCWICSTASRCVIPACVRLVGNPASSSNMLTGRIVLSIVFMIVF